MSFLDPRIWLFALAAFAAGIFGGELHGRFVTRADIAAAKKAADELIRQKEAEVEAVKQRQEVNLTKVRITHEQEMLGASRVIAALKLRLNPAGTGSVPANASGTAAGHGADPLASRVCIEDGSALVSLMEETTKSLAAGRACQNFLKLNGLE
jgi:hypothetical protein